MRQLGGFNFSSGGSRVFLMMVCTLALGGCYYFQAARGQLDVMNKREPIDELVAADATPEKLTKQLELVMDARQFAVDELYLPDNDSYRSYADLGRDYVVWNVFAAPEFSLEPKTWCFPIAGCVAYRGYFSEEAAQRKAAQLRGDGFDVFVGGVPAYSTLGKFDDPVLNTMMHWDDTRLVATIFHELAHQELYIRDDTEFNESFASAVEEFGIERWLASRGEKAEFDSYLERQDLSQRLMDMISGARADLEELFTSSMAPHEMRAGKQRRLEQLRGALGEELERSGQKAPGWLNGDLNNARLVSMGLYRNRLPEFRALYEKCERDLQCFYDGASSLQLAGSSTTH
jgi:predicted aminopeptidase